MPRNAGPIAAERLAKTPTDPDAFACLYRRYEVAMLHFFKRRVRDTETAADLTAEVFASALASASRFRPGDGPAASWLFGIAHHKLASSWRRGRVEDRARRRLGMAPIELTDDDLDRVDALVEDLDVNELLAGLPADQRAAVQARVLDERSYRGREITADAAAAQGLVCNEYGTPIVRCYDSLAEADAAHRAQTHRQFPHSSGGSMS